MRRFFWSVFSGIRTEDGDLFTPKSGKYGPEKTPYLDNVRTVFRDRTSCLIFGFRKRHFIQAWTDAKLNKQNKSIYHIFFFFRYNSQNINNFLWYHTTRCFSGWCCIIQKYSPRTVLKKGVLKNFAKLTGKDLCCSLFFKKVARPKRASLLKRRLRHGSFRVNFAKSLRIPLL